jgi:hypothetical protein
VNGTGLYVDREYMTVSLSANQTLAATNAYVPVRRGTGGTAANLHANSSVVWVALTPSEATVPGMNGFMVGSNMTEVGPCTRTGEAYLPHIWPVLGVMRDCSLQVGSTTVGVWTDWNVNGNTTPGPQTFTVSAATGANTIGAVPGTYVITGATANTITLTAPTAGVMDGMVIKVISGSAVAHTITCSSHLIGGTSTSSVATFAAYKGASITLVAYNGDWLVVASTGVTLS